MKLISKIRKKLRLNVGPVHALSSFSQEGEDLVLRRFLPDEHKPGFYVDIGAHHPERFSNTAFYSMRGWTGINIDADPDLMDVFTELRAKDINLALGVGLKEGALNFFVFNEKALNTFDAKLAKERSEIPHYSIVETKKVRILPLEKILKQHLPSGQQIDFMSVDVEGRDLEVLQSNDWKKYRPSFVITECLKARNLLEIRQDPVVKYMAKHGYEPIAKTLYSIIFKDVLGE